MDLITLDDSNSRDRLLILCSVKKHDITGLHLRCLGFAQICLPPLSK